MPDSGIEPMLPADLAPPPAADDTLLLTYRELAERLGVSADGARALARRQHWPVSRDEHGRSLVLVAAAALAQQQERRGEHERVERTDTRAMAARVAEMVAALKAEIPPAGTPIAGDVAEQLRMVGLMRQFLDMYERERMGWFSALNDLNAQLDEFKAEARGLAEAQDKLIEAQQQERGELLAAHDKLIDAQQQERAELVAAREAAETALAEARAGFDLRLSEARASFDAQLSEARAAAGAAEAKHDQAQIQHQRALSDLGIIHNDQRSLWLLERRRLEAMVEALEQGRRWRWPALGIQPMALVRAAFAVVVVALASIALARDTGPSHPVLHRDRPDFARAPQAGLAPSSLPQTWPTR